MEKQLNIGDEVLIFNYIPEWSPNQDMTRYKIGHVIEKKLSHDLSYHGSPWCVMNYTIIGNDGRKYFGNYIHPTLGDSFFMKEEDYIEYLKQEIIYKQNKIYEIQKEIIEIQERIESVQEKEKRLIKGL